jgi:S-disulfanyl-L-cysteine oxidoreductase SoxD
VTGVRRSSVALLGLAAACSVAAAQRSVWDGIYTAEQAMRGRTEYMQACASCHAEDLRGKGTAPALVEESFAFQWEDMPLGELLERTRKLMPLDRPNSLSPQAYRDIVAFLLEANKFPAGRDELAGDPEALRDVVITMKKR